jgi:hypothetical protein
MPCSRQYVAATAESDGSTHLIPISAIRHYPETLPYVRDLKISLRESGIAATELPLRVHLGLKLAAPLCAAI